MSLTLKNPRGWFAAGVEVVKALMILSDGAFKLFVYLCLNAQRETGITQTSQTVLARSLKKTKGTIRRYLQEMEKAGICRTRFDNNPKGRGIVEFVDIYWPYQRTSPETASDDSDPFVLEIKKMLQAQACIRSSFSTADEILARQWFGRGIEIERIERAILMGCARKYVSWRNNKSTAPIASLRYFEPILDELEALKVGVDYWDYLRSRIVRMEKLWIKEHQDSTAEEGGSGELSQTLTKLPPQAERR